MKILLVLFLMMGTAYGAKIEGKNVATSVVNLIEALKKSKVIDNDFTNHKFEIEKFEGHGAGFNIIIKVFNPLHPEKVGRKIHCQTFYKEVGKKMIPDFEKFDCK